MENRRNRLRLAKIAAEAAVKNKSSVKKGPKILLAPSFSIFHTLKIHDILFTSLLAAKGARLAYLSSPFGLPFCQDCGGINNLAQTQQLCAYCRRFSRNDRDLSEHLKQFAQIYEPTEFVSQAEISKLQRLAFALSDSELAEFIYEGLPIGQYSLDLVRNKGYVSNIQLVPDYQNFVRKAIFSNLLFHTYFKNTLAKFQPEVILSHDAFYAPWRIIHDLALAARIPIYNYYPGMRSNTFFYAKNKITFNLDMAPLFEKWRNRDISKKELQKIQKLFKTRNKLTIYDMPTKAVKKDGEQTAYERIIKSKRPLAILYTNVLWDVMTLNKDTIFSSIQQSYLETVRFFIKHPEYNLIVKPHPLDLFKGHESKEQADVLINTAFGKLPDNILVLPPNTPITSYGLIGQADVSIVYTTTVGMESAILGTPVITIGAAHYANKGFTSDPKGSEDYFAALKAMLDRPQHVSKQQQALAKKYYYLMNFVYWYDFGIIKYDFRPHRNRATVIPRKLANLLGNSEFNELADAVLAKQDVPFFDKHLLS